MSLNKKKEQEAHQNSSRWAVKYQPPRNNSRDCQEYQTEETSADCTEIDNEFTNYFGASSENFTEKRVGGEPANKWAGYSRFRWKDKVR